MTKLCKRLFQWNTWPISVRWTGTGRANYSMKPEIAAWWSKPGNLGVNFSETAATKNVATATNAGDPTTG